MTDPLVSIIIRSFNEGWALRDTLPAVQAQEYWNWELIVVDSGSTDGSVELIQAAAPRHFIRIKPEEYNPSRVMNLAMQLARSEFGIFLNADATPQGTDWLRPLVAPLLNPQVAAVFGKQIPRPDCRAVYAHDYERCFGPHRESRRWDHFFSMASSGIRKDIWARRGFQEKMQYSEDDEYTRWCRQQGYQIVYVPDSVVMHSHNYTPQQAYRRSFGEAKALAAVWTGRPQAVNWPRTVLFGWLNDARRDLGFCARRNCLREWPNAARIRWEQRRARLAGFREGWNFYRNGHSSEAAALDLPTPDESHGPARFKDLGLPMQRAANAVPRFTQDGSDALENHLTDMCAEVLAGVRALIPDSKLEALVLGGGYGRGQGGVLKSKTGDRPYNDLEFYVFLRGHRLWNEHRYGAALRQFGERLSPTAGLHVEFKVDSLMRLRRSPVTMFSYDLVSGHRVLWHSKLATLQRFNESVFAGCEHHLDAANIPANEATRLLFNRCTGLLLAAELLQRPRLTNGRADFIGRNLAKAQLALGDVVLAVFGQYHWSCLERRERLNRLAADWNAGLSTLRCTAAEDGRPRVSGSDLSPPSWLPEILRYHTAGVNFKLHPIRAAKSVRDLQCEHHAISSVALRVWLWLESYRLQQSFDSARGYAFSPVQKCPDTSASRNLLLNARAFGPGGVFGRQAGRYPRERLLNSLPLLLWEMPLNDLNLKRFLKNQLRTTASDWQSLVTAYKRLWPAVS